MQEGNQDRIVEQIGKIAKLVDGELDGVESTRWKHFVVYLAFYKNSLIIILVLLR